MLPEEFKPKTKTVNFMLLDGGVGDHVGSLVAVDYVMKRYPWITPLIWVPDYFKEFAQHLLGPDAQVFNYSQMKTRYNPNYPTKTTKWDGSTSPMKMHTVDYAFLKLCDEAPDTIYKNFLQIASVPVSIVDECQAKYGNYVVITTGFTAEVREFPAVEINKISQYLVSRNITPLFLGSTTTKTGGKHEIKGVFKEEIDFSLGHNLINKTSLLQAAQIMSGARAVIGVDNGLLHIAACTQVPIVAGFTTVEPKFRIPIRNNRAGWRYYPIDPDNTLKCKFCQSNTNFLYGHDYRNCLIKGENKNLCTRQMTAEKFIHYLKFIQIDRQPIIYP